MTTVIKKNDPFPNEPAGLTLDVEQVFPHIINYWKKNDGTILPEKFYTISLNEVKEMLAASATNPHSVAIRVSNIDNPEIVKVSWEIFNGSGNNQQNEGTLPNNSSGDILFILDQDEFNSWGAGLNGVNALTVRLAKSDNGNRYVFVHHSAITFKKTGGTGGDTFSAGVKIPS